MARGLSRAGVSCSAPLSSLWRGAGGEVNGKMQGISRYPLRLSPTVWLVHRHRVGHHVGFHAHFVADGDFDGTDRAGIGETIIDPVQRLDNAHLIRTCIRVHLARSLIGADERLLIDLGSSVPDVDRAAECAADWLT